MGYNILHMVSFRKPFFLKRSVQSAGVVGSESITPATVSAQSFGERQHVERNRSMVGGYSQAKLGFRGHLVGTSRSTPPTRIPSSNSERSTHVSVQRRTMDGVLTHKNSPRNNFHEPESRHYNPYG